MATTGKINIGLFDGAGNKWDGPEAVVTLRDPFTNSDNKKPRKVEVPRGKHTVSINDVAADAGQRYIVFVDADKHRSHAVFPVKPRPNAVTSVRMMLIRNDPEPDFSKFNYKKLLTQAPEFHDALSKNITESDLLGLARTDEKFGLIRIASLLNIEAKLRAQSLRLGSGGSYVKLVEKIECCERDRIKVFVKPQMPAHVAEMDTFSELNEDLNELNHAGFPVSYKEKVPFGSLQLSFAKTAVTKGLEADIDIDLFTDIGHFGEVVKNKITKTKTDPFSIYVQLFDQNVRPLYTLKV